MESIIDSLKRRLREVGRARWDEIAAGAGVNRRLPEKIVYGERPNLGIRYAQALLDALDAHDATAKRRGPARRRTLTRPEA